MKKTLALIAVLIMMMAASNAFAQNSRLATTITKYEHTSGYSLGRDFWFAPGQNYIDQPGKYIRLYITSPSNTTAYVELLGVKTAINVPSYGVGTFDVPLSDEMKSSGIVEDKGIHVYDNTDDIEVYLMSHNEFSSDGMYCIPTIGWGTDYVVASYNSVYQGPDAYQYDLPSEFTITANQNGTIVDITPSCDLRLANAYSQNDIFTAFPEGQKFSVTLMRGQSVQYQSVVATDTGNYDVTGTVLHTNAPVCVVGASMCANIPQDFQYGNYITDMMPPIRTWGETYYTTNTAQPQGMTGHDFSLYLIISTLPNQVIYRQDFSGVFTEAQLGSTFDYYFVEEEGGNKWWSDHPFLLVQYINCASYPDGVFGNGDPSEVVVPAVENYTKDVIFMASSNGVNEMPYENVVNLIVHVVDEGNVFVDGHNVRQYNHQPVDGIIDFFTIPISSGAHIVKSDSGVGVYVYGYGFDESYIWGSQSGVGTFHSPDTVPPAVKISGECFTTNIHITDSGFLPGSTTLVQSGLNEIRLDSDINMAYLPDPYPEWIEGTARDTSGISMYVIDETKPARLIVDVFDAAGNETIISSIYTPQDASIKPPLQDFGVSSTGAPASIRYDTITNLGKTPFDFTTLRLEYGNRGFTIDSVVSSPLAVGEKRVIKIEFYPVEGTSVVDSLIFGDACGLQEVALTGSGGAPDFYVSDATWLNVPLNPIPAGSWTEKAVVIHNLSKIGMIHVSNAGFAPGWPNSSKFVLAPGQTLPIAISPLDTAQVQYYFEPTDLLSDTAVAMWTAPEVDSADGSPSPRYDKLIGNAVTSVLTFTGDTIVNLYCEDSSIHSVTLSFLLSNIGTQNGVLAGVFVTDPNDFTNLTGYDQHGVSWDPAKQEENISPNSVDTFKVIVPIDALSNSSVSTQIISQLLGQEPDTLTATVNVNYSSYSVNAGSITFGPVAHGSGKVVQQFAITNTASSILDIGSVALIEGGKYNSSYSYTTNPSFPDSILPGQFVTVTVTFDPSVSKDAQQNTVMQIYSDACNADDVSLNATVTAAGVAEAKAPASAASVVTLDDGQSIRVTIPSDWASPVRLDVYDILGERIFNSTFDGNSTFDLGKLPREVYFYRLRTEQTTQTGKIIIGE